MPETTDADLQRQDGDWKIWVSAIVIVAAAVTLRLISAELRHGSFACVLKISKVSGHFVLTARSEWVASSREVRFQCRAH